MDAAGGAFDIWRGICDDKVRYRRMICWVSYLMYQYPTLVFFGDVFYPLSSRFGDMDIQ